MLLWANNFVVKIKSSVLTDDDFRSVVETSQIYYNNINMYEILFS